jgi:putative transposase
MREAGIVSRQRRRHKYKSPGVEALVAPHVLKRKFDVTAVNQVWCGDVTYIKVGKRWLYFAAVLDLFARRIVGWSFSMTSDATLTCETLRMAMNYAVTQKMYCFTPTKVASTPAINSEMNCWNMDSGRA